MTFSKAFEKLEKMGFCRVVWNAVAVLFVLWLLGFSLHVGGGLVHALLVIALVVFVYGLLTRRSSV